MFADDKRINRLEPHKRLFHSIILAMFTKDDKPWFCFGVMCDDMQPRGHVQMFMKLIDFDMIDWQQRFLYGGGEPRKDGVAVGS